MKKIICLIGLFIIVIFTLTGCMTPKKSAWKPGRQPNTQWVSEDKTITFYVDNNYQIIGTMNVGDELIDVCIYYGAERSSAMNIYPANVLEDHVMTNKLRYEYWLCSFKSEKEFVATVRETTYFKEGEKIRFYRVGE